MADDCIDAHDCHVQTDDDNYYVGSGSQLIQLRRSTVVSYTRDTASHTITSSSTEPWSGPARGWLERFPQLKAAVTGISHAQRCLQIWKALGQNKWMEFVDGRAHAGGPDVFDTAETSGQPGVAVGHSSYKNQALAREEFSTEQAWESRWSVDKLAALNAKLRGWQCEEPSCRDMIDNYGSVTSIDANKKHEWLTRILSDYHSAIDAIQVDMTDMGSGARIDQALPHIAVLYHKLALLHPFADGNSRTRLMVLQTELVRQGGHPTMLWDNFWGIYRMPDLPKPDGDLNKLQNYNLSAFSDELSEFVLDGWCGWETAYNSKASPFSPFVEVDGTSMSTPYSQYNAETGACEQGPGREFWVSAFNKDHPDDGEDLEYLKHL